MATMTLGSLKEQRVAEARASVRQQAAVFTGPDVATLQVKANRWLACVAERDLVRVGDATRTADGLWTLTVVYRERDDESVW